MIQESRQSKAEMDRYLGINQVADMLHRSPAAIRNLVMRRKIPFRKPGGRLLFIESEIKQWVETSPGITPEQATQK